MISASAHHHWTIEDIKREIESSRVVVFSKGTQQHPRCGFSEKALHAVEKCGRPFEVIDVSENRSIRAALRAYTGQSSLPAIYVDGNLVADPDALTKCVEDEIEERIDHALAK